MSCSDAEKKAIKEKLEELKEKLTLNLGDMLEKVEWFSLIFNYALFKTNFRNKLFSNDNL